MAFSKLYCISRNKEFSIAEVMHFPNQMLHWDILFSRAIQDWELEPSSIFMDLIYSMPLKGEACDKLCWKSGKRKGFKVREYYFSLSLTSGIPFPWKPMWRSTIPHRVAFFSWNATLGKILTLDNLWNRGATIVDWCYMCKRSEESVNHLLLHCPLAFELRTMMWNLFGLLWVMSQSVTNLFSAWQGPFGKNQNMAL